MGKDHNVLTSLPNGILTAASSNMGVLQTTVAEIVTVKEHQRESKPRLRECF